MKIVSTTAALLVAAMLGGCAGTHLYNEENAKIAARAKETYGKVSLVELAAKERQNLLKLRDAEISSLRDHLETERDLILLNITEFEWGIGALSFPSSGCKAPDAKSSEVVRATLDRCYLENRARDLGITTKEQLAQLAGLEVRRPTPDVQGVQQRLKSEFGWAQPPSCEKIPHTAPEAVTEGFTPVRRRLLAAQLVNLHRLCTKPVADLGQGELNRALVAVTAARASLASLTEAETAAKEKLKAQGDAYAKAVAQRGASIEERTKDYVKEINKIRKLLGVAEKGLDKIGVDSAFADETINAIDTILGAAGGQTIADDAIAKDEELAKAVLVAKSLPQLAAEMTAAYDAYRAPPVSALLIAKQQALIERDFAAARKAAAEQMLAARRSRLAALLQEAGLLNEAARHAADQKDCKEGATCARFYYRSTSALSRSITVARANAVAADRDAAYVDGLENIARSEYALRSWDNLIGTPVALLDGYHASGIKPEDLSDLIVKTGGLGVLAIIAGKVN